MKKNIKLPNKPSELIELALKDLILTECNPKYKINMDKWHSPNGVCSVCQAGCVMAQTMKLPRTKTYYPSMFPDETNLKLDALDDLRRVFWDDFEDKLDVKTDFRYMSGEYFSRYEQDSVIYKMQLQTIAEFYKSINL